MKRRNFLQGLGAATLGTLPGASRAATSARTSAPVIKLLEIGETAGAFAQAVAQEALPEVAETLYLGIKGAYPALPGVDRALLLWPSGDIVPDSGDDDWPREPGDWPGSLTSFEQHVLSRRADIGALIDACDVLIMVAPIRWPTSRLLPLVASIGRERGVAVCAVILTSVHVERSLLCPVEATELLLTEALAHHTTVISMGLGFAQGFASEPNSQTLYATTLRAIATLLRIAQMDVTSLGDLGMIMNTAARAYHVEVTTLGMSCAADELKRRLASASDWLADIEAGKIDLRGRFSQAEIIVLDRALRGVAARQQNLRWIQHFFPARARMPDPEVSRLLANARELFDRLHQRVDSILAAG